MSCLRLLNLDYSNIENFANRFFSSQNTNFPATNLDDIYRRYKSWRTDGYFNIVAGLNTIVFRESVGVDLTATITVDEYVSDSLFFAAIKSALDAAGASTYTVSRSTTTKKIQIVSDGLGGGGIFELRFATSTAMAAILGFDDVNLSGSLTYVADDISLHTEEFLIWDMGVPLNPTDFCVAGLRNDFINVSPSATIKLQGNHTNNWSAPAYEQTIVFDDRLFYLHSATGLHTEPLRYWRFYVQDKRNPLGYIEINLSFVGISQDFDRGCVRFPLRNTSRDPSVVSFSEGGNTFVEKRQKSQFISLDWNGLTKEDREALFNIFEQKGLSEPFFLSADTSAAFSSKKENWVKWVRFDSDVSEELVSPNNFAMAMTLREEL
jgi:hypothetical protein